MKTAYKVFGERQSMISTYTNNSLVRRLKRREELFLKKNPCAFLRSLGKFDCRIVALLRRHDVLVVNLERRNGILEFLFALLHFDRGTLRKLSRKLHNGNTDLVVPMRDSTNLFFSHNKALLRIVITTFVSIIAP